MKLNRKSNKYFNALPRDRIFLLLGIVMTSIHSQAWHFQITNGTWKWHFLTGSTI